MTAVTWAASPGRCDCDCRAKLRQSVCLTGRHPRCRRRRCRSHAGRGCHGPGHTALWFSDLHERRLLGRRAAGPSVERGGDERAPLRVGRDGLGDPGAAGGLADDPPAPCRSSRRPSAARNTGPSVRSTTARPVARAVRGASGTVTTLPPLRVIVSVRCPRSRPRCSMSAPAADEMLVARAISTSPANLPRRPGAEYSCSPAVSTHSLTPACPMCSASPTTSRGSGSVLPDDPRRHPASTTNGAPRDHRRHLLIVRDRDRRALVAEPRGRGYRSTC